MSYSETEAAALLRGDRERGGALATRLLVPLHNNFVERPWGGLRLRAFKRFYELPDQLETTGLGLGEAFEIAAYDEDEEAARYPSRLRLDDGSIISLAALLRAQGDTLLGTEFVAAYGPCFPLLPKVLDIKELLSVQGHPAGNTEVYVIVEAEPGATIRLGFADDMDAGELEQALLDGLATQRALAERTADTCSAHALQRALAPWFATRETGLDALDESLPVARNATLDAELEALKSLYWNVLDRMNAVTVSAGQVIYNATPERIRQRTGAPVAAEVHALGNPERREIVALEIRRPGPTFRAWDNVRFPMRAVDVRAAIRALNLARTQVEDFVVEPEPAAGRPGVSVSVDCEFFRLEHLRPAAAQSVHVPDEGVHCLHVIDGSVEVHGADGRSLGRLERGQSALVPKAVGAYEVAAAQPAHSDVHVVKVSLPL